MSKSTCILNSTPLTNTFDSMYQEHHGRLIKVRFQYPNALSQFKPELTLIWDDGYTLKQTFDNSFDGFESWVGQLNLHLFCHQLAPYINMLDFRYVTVEFCVNQL